MITLKTKISDLKRKDLKRLDESLLKVCKKQLGSKKGISITPTRIRDCFGYYDPETKSIKVNRKNCTTVEQYVNVVIHEYRHSKQVGLQKFYLAFNEIYGYWNNPYEVDARETANILRPLIWKNTKELLKKELK